LDSEAAKEKPAFAFCLPDGAAWREAESIRYKIIKINYLQQILHVYYLNNTMGNSGYFLEKIEFFPFSAGSSRKSQGPIPWGTGPVSLYSF
jgi:hypothetical protein